MAKRIVPVGEGERKRLTIKFRSPSLPYEEIAELIRQGFDVFISKVTTRTAYYAKRRLSQLLGKQVNAWPATFDRTPGYLFSIRTGEEVLGTQRR